MKNLITGFLLTFLIMLSTVSAQTPNFSDTHSDGALNGWTNRGSRAWNETNGSAVPQNGSLNTGFLICNYAATNDGAIEVDMTADQWNGGNGGIILRWTSSQSYIFIAVKPGNQWDSWIKFCRNSLVAENGTTVASGFTMGTSLTLRVEMEGSTFRFFVNGTQRGQISDTLHPSGSFGYAHNNSWNQYASFSAVRWWDRNVTQYPLTVTTTGNGSVSPQSGTYPQNTQVTITATANSGWVFDRWSGDASDTANPLIVTMNSAKNIVANFSQLPTYQLSVTTDGNGTVNPASGSYVQGTQVEVTATPAAGWAFVNWTGDITSQANPVTITMNSNRSVIAHFVQITHTLTSEIVGNGSVTPASGEFAENSVVSITAAPASGWRFTRWTGDASGTQNPISVQMTGDRHVVANFEQIMHPLSVTIGGNGSVTPSSGNYPEGSTVIITATPDTGWIFSGWSGDANGSTNPLSLVMSQAMNITATFVQRTFTLTASSDTNGTVSPESVVAPEGSSVTITATPNSGFIFDHWSGAVSGTENPLTVVLNNDMQIMAHFIEYIPQEFTLSTGSTGHGSVSPETGSYTEHSVVEVTATPETGWRFSHWEGSIQGTENPVSVTMDSDMNAIAVFVIDNSTIPNNQKIAISARLFDQNDQPVGRDTAVIIDLAVKIYDAQADGAVLYTEMFERAYNNGVTVDDGYFIARLGEGETANVLADVINGNNNLWVEITVGDNVLPRTPLTAAAYSLR